MSSTVVHVYFFVFDGKQLSFQQTKWILMSNRVWCAPRAPLWKRPDETVKDFIQVDDWSSCVFLLCRLLICTRWLQRCGRRESRSATLSTGAEPGIVPSSLTLRQLAHGFFHVTHVAHRNGKHLLKSQSSIKCSKQTVLDALHVGQNQLQNWADFINSQQSGSAML